jgi:hypothetical protein
LLQRLEVFDRPDLEHDLVALPADRPVNRSTREERMRSGTVRHIAVRDALAQEFGRLEGTSQVVRTADPRHRQNLAALRLRAQLPVLVSLATTITALALAAPAAASVGWWSTTHAQRALHSMKLARAGVVNTVRCHGTGRARAGLYSTFRCTVFGQVPAGASVAANVTIQVLSSTRYKRLTCQTASMPLTDKVCP